MANFDIIDELKKYDVVGVDEEGEIDVYEKHLFLKVIRRRELEIILHHLLSGVPKLVLDYGCGAGWLTAFLYSRGLSVIGVDINANLIRNAKRVCPNAEFVVCDGTRLPFRDEAFDFTIGISILHHLRNLEQACFGLKRVLVGNSRFIFMEPNSLTPFSAFGRKFFPMEAHTIGEKQFTPEYLKTLFGYSDFIIEARTELFFFAFPVSRFLKIARMKLNPFLVKTISLFESFMERLPGVKHLNSTIVVVGTVSK